MNKNKSNLSFSGVWSAAPTPFTDKWAVDKASVRRMVNHHLRLGITGFFLAGTNGEGPWMPDRERRTLVQTVAKYAKGKLPIAVQVTDNSAARILDNMRTAKEDGADIAVIAPPFFRLNNTPKSLLELYQEAIRSSPLPVGIYDRGNTGAVPIPDRVIKTIYNEPNVVLIKDSSTDPKRRLI
ncbi:MAG: dihydrodipicolinate synthase family protein, partial [bacterium]|nr:dihydrodipicolinate synthase family protein [bacterium]